MKKQQGKSRLYRFLSLALCAALLCSVFCALPFCAYAAAPGYAMCYMWGIRHLDGDPWRKTRIDDPEHAWLWKPDANAHIFNPEE